MFSVQAHLAIMAANRMAACMLCQPPAGAAAAQLAFIGALERRITVVLRERNADDMDNPVDMWIVHVRCWNRVCAAAAQEFPGAPEETVEWFEN